ncbi:MAG: ROK family transcriptional regulator [Chloroflexi bacterium]|nr:ROK family transcriptional regulator [Chloroflexota bacterium]MCI0577510.1 ROK family transcriptional regulator [Chloroflexota bacterium]MCI0645652.1 ROK family transcriptional regulator [Chloroflexota bacterium]MCI0725564.1 ROK family transcriptional regulator [Chloroflexota bacterium]
MATHTIVDLTSVRANNLSRVLNLIREAGSISRAALVRQTGLSATTVSALANDLLASGFVHESGTGRSGGGRPPILLQFDYKFRHVVGVDMGATHLTAVAMDLQGCVVARHFCHYDVIGNPQGTMATICQLAERVIAEAGLEPSRILGLGITIPAPLEGQNLDRLTTIYMPAWEGLDLLGTVQQAFAFPVYLDNDANAGAIAEKWWGVGRSFSNLAYIKLGTGVGSGLILKNEIYRGNGGTAGEIGHTTIDPDGPRCRCGNRGCMESFVGAPAVLAEVARRFDGRRPAWAPEDGLTLNAITTAALAGDPVCRSVVEEAGAYLGIAVANLVNLINPGLVVLGGDLGEAGDLLINTVQAAVLQRAMPKAAREARIVLSELGDDAVAIGAATLAIQHAFEPSNLANTLKTTERR